MEYIDYIDDLIAKVLAEEATVTEQAELRTWLKESDEHSHYFNDMQRIWTLSSDIFSIESGNPIYAVDTEGGWQAVQKRLEKPNVQAHSSLTISWLQPRLLLRLAAAVAVLAVAGIWFFAQKAVHTEGVEIVAIESPIEKTLVDKSDIKLSKASKLTTAFTEKERRVKLEGEAFFKVASDTMKPFIVEVQNLEIKVVGTEFNVDNVSEAGKVIVTVTEGKVLLSTGRHLKEGQGNDQAFLIKGMKAIYDTATGDLAIQNQEQAEVMPSLNFLLNRRKMHQVAKDLSKYFKMDIQIGSPAIENCEVNTDFSNQNLDMIIDLLKDTYPSFEFIKTAKGYMIKGDSCQE
jgi:ferric-dicitrate binding protein FerR (iron transport regulator)